MQEYNYLSPVAGADGIFRSRGDCLRSTETLSRYCRNSYARAGNFHPYRLLVIVSFNLRAELSFVALTLQKRTVVQESEFLFQLLLA